MALTKMTKMLLALPLVLHQALAVCRPYLRVEDNLAEPSNRGFCPDVVGFRSSINFERPMQVSCSLNSSYANHKYVKYLLFLHYVSDIHAHAFCLEAHTCKSGTGADCHFIPEESTSGTWLLKGLQVCVTLGTTTCFKIQTHILHGIVA